MKILFILILCTGIFGLTLPEAQKQLLSANPEILSSGVQTKIAGTQLLETRSLWHPSVNLYSTVNWFSEKQSIDMPPPIGKRTLGDRDRFESGVDLSLPLFTGFSRYYTVKSAGADLKAQEEIEKSVRNRLSYQLGMIYFAWELALRQVDVQKALLAQIREYSSYTRNREAAGLSTTAQVADADARLALNQAELFNIQNRTDSLKMEILFLIQGKDTSIAPQEYKDFADAALLDTVTAPDTARPELKALSLGNQSLISRNRALWGKRLPQVAGLVGYRFANPGLNMGSADYMNYGVAGLQVNFNLYDGFRTRRQSLELKERIEALDLEKNRLLSRFSTDIERGRMSLKRAQLQKEAALASVKAAQESVESTRNAVDAGTATSLEYLDALSRLAQSRFLLEQSIFLIKNASLTLLFSQGKDIVF
jgi:outer membrane protein TolC